jgi:hypothetical protein
MVFMNSFFIKIYFWRKEYVKEKNPDRLYCAFIAAYLYYAGIQPAGSKGIKRDPKNAEGDEYYYWQLVVRL